MLTLPPHPGSSTATPIVSVGGTLRVRMPEDGVFFSSAYGFRRLKLEGASSKQISAEVKAMQGERIPWACGVVPRREREVKELSPEK